MTDLPTSTCSVASGASPSPQDGPDTEPSASAKSTNGASESSESIGQMFLFGETCERWTPTMYATPQAHDAQGGSAERVRRFGSRHGGRNLSDETVAGISPFSPLVTPASHSQSPGSDWARKMTATYGRKFADYWLSFAPPDSWVRTLLDTSVWASTMCYLTWKRSATPQGRLLFRLVPSTPRTAGIGSGFWPTPNVNSPNNRAEYPTSGDGLNTAVKRSMGILLPSPMPSDVMGGRTTKGKDRQNETGLRLAAAVAKGESNLKLNSAWVSRMMGYPDGFLTLDGEAIP